MTDGELTALITAGVGGFAGFCRWAIRLWATVRREGIVAAKEAAAHQRADSERMVSALLEQVKSNAMLAGKLDQLSEKIELLVEWRDRTPIEMPAPTDEHPSERRRRMRTVPQGHRTAKGNDDD